MGPGVTVWGDETGMEASKTMWRVVTVFIGPKPKGGRGQVLRTCRSSLEHERSRRRLDRRRRRMGWRRESLCCSPPAWGPRFFFHSLLSLDFPLFSEIQGKPRDRPK